MIGIALRAGLLACVLAALSACGGKSTSDETSHAVSQTGTDAAGSDSGTFATPPASGSSAASGSIEERLGLDVPTAKSNSIEALVGGSGYTLIGSIWQSFKKLPKSDRADAIRALALCLKAYFESNEFATEYAKMRTERKPTPPVFEQTVDQELEAQLAESKHNLDETRKNVLPMLPPADRAELEKALAQQQAQMSDPTMAGYLRQGIEANRAGAQTSYESDLARWQTGYPEEPKGLIVQRLNQFIALISDVDFDAALVEKDGMKRFAKPEYEAKPSDWKTVYRVGRPGAEAAREVATQWLAELR